MKPAKLNPYTITRGATYKETLIFSNNGEPLNLSAFTAIRMDIRDKASQEGTLLKSLSLGSGITVTGNRLSMTVPAAETKDWAPGTYHRDIVMVDAGGITDF